MTISELTKRKGGNNIGIAFGEQNRESKRIRSTTYCEILTKQQHLTKGLLQSKKKTNVCCRPAGNTGRRSSVANRLFWICFEIFESKINTLGLLFVAYTHTHNLKPTRNREERNITQNHCIKVETLVVIIQAYAPHFTLNARNNLWKLCVKGFA